MKPNPKILAFGCHPDDVEILCGGTLALLARLDCDIHIAVMAGGDVGSPVLPRFVIREQRLKEGQAAADIIGAQFHFAGGEDLEVEYNDAYRRRAVRVMREVNPDIVLTHSPMDYLIDHEETSRLVRNAAFIGIVPNYDCGAAVPPTSKIPHLYYANAIGRRDIFGRPLPLTCAVDVSPVMETKTRMLACHASQREWLRCVLECDDYLEMMQRATEAEGRAAGFGYAEGYIQHLGEGHPQDNILKQLLGDACLEFHPASTVNPVFP
ncbi:MAG: PIG-L family deacetylase [Luteolibacter sp.]|jgi:LmbE family N-acetylglucosaminyl deacetylase|nr:PIG-L family deacetylase [Luteolibacter sp.]